MRVKTRSIIFKFHNSPEPENLRHEEDLLSYPVINTW